VPSILKRPSRGLGKSVLCRPRSGRGRDSASWAVYTRPLILVTLFLAGCATVPRRPGTGAYWPTEGWRVSAPEAQGVDSLPLANMLAEIEAQDYAIDSVSVVRHGYLVLDAYVHPYGPGQPHEIRSCTKSVVSALIGIAIQEGAVEGVDQPLLDLFPGRTAAYRDARKEAIVLEHVLTMSSGLMCRDSYLYRWRGLTDMRRSADWVQYMLDLPMAEAPGTHFEYCNGGSFLLSAILQEATGQTALEYAGEHLFGPLGIADVTWPANPQGISIGWGEMRMRPHDMLKIGYLYLNEGRWEDQQIVPAGWVAGSTRKHIDGTLQDGYGYQWWVAGGGVYMALGYGGQYILVAPDLDMVVVLTSELAEQDFYLPQRLFERYIRPAVKSSRPLAEDAEGVALLQSYVKALARP
jgi:CubicO group peptidase (beta-lactamase class C family)